MDGGAPEHPTWHWLWDLYIGAMCGVAIGGVLLLDESVPGRSPVGAVAALAAMWVWLTVIGRRVPRLGALGRRPVAYVLVAVALWCVAMWCAPASVAAIPAMFPAVFSTLPLGTAIGAAVAIAVLPLGLVLAESGPSSRYLTVALAVALMGLVTGPILGIFIVTSVRQRMALTRLVNELRDSRAETSRLSREAGVAAERERLAREIHDTLAQGFTSIVALAQAIEAELGGDPAAAARHLALIESTARENLTEARTMVTRLTPTALDGATLPAAIRRLCTAFQAETGIAVRDKIAEGTPSVGMAVDVVLLRAAQEALANIRQHSGADSVTVTLDGDARGVRLTLSDNGIGLSQPHADGFGLRGMRSRVAQVGGSVTLSGDRGVRLDIEVPA